MLKFPLVVTMFNLPTVADIAFYREYAYQHWLYKMTVLYNLIKNFQTSNLNLVYEEDELHGPTPDAEYLAFLKLELHFLYFQMIEALFKLIESVICNNGNFWETYTSSLKQDKALSDTISKLAGDESLLEEFKKNVSFAGNNTSLLQYIFYYTSKCEITEELEAESLNNICKLIHRFAIDYSDQMEYQAYKHGLRLYHTHASMTLRNEKTGISHPVLDNSEMLVFFKNGKTGLMKINRTFSFEHDYKKCQIVYELIKNIMLSRRSEHMPEFLNKAVKLMFYPVLDLSDIFESKTEFTFRLNSNISKS